MALTEKYGLNRPVWMQYGIYIGNLLGGDLGTSIVSGRRVTDIIAEAFPVSCWKLYEGCPKGEKDGGTIT